MLKLKLQYYTQSQLIGKNLDARKALEQKEKGATENEMVVWIATLTQWT